MLPFKCTFYSVVWTGEICLLNIMPLVPPLLDAQSCFFQVDRQVSSVPVSWHKTHNLMGSCFSERHDQTVVCLWLKANAQSCFKKGLSWKIIQVYWLAGRDGAGLHLLLHSAFEEILKTEAVTSLLFCSLHKNDEIVLTFESLLLFFFVYRKFSKNTASD